ncbi:MAG TPA: lytic transglycosylase domain-containing protein [Sphingomonadaceae bacterium]
MRLFRTSRAALTLLASGIALAAAAPAMAENSGRIGAEPSAAIPTLLSSNDRDYYRSLFAAIDKEDWTKVQQMFADRPTGPLHQVALAEYYLAAHSPKVDAGQVQQWLANGGTALPQAQQLVNLGLKRGLTDVPQLPVEQPFYRQPASPQRTRPATVADGTMPDTVRQAILDRITNDDPDGARQLLDGVDAALSPEARAEWRERVAWSYYIENRDADSLALAQTVSDGAGPWVAEGDWNAGLAAWRQNDCVNSLAGFERAAGHSTNPELTAASWYWANRAAVRCREPEKAATSLKRAAALDETLYGMLAAEALGTSLPKRAAGQNFARGDWDRLKDDNNVRVAIELSEVGRDDLASEVLLHQARIGDASDYASLARLARGLGLPTAQLYMAYNAPPGAKADLAARYPVTKWQPVDGWQVDPELAYAHIMQESRFQTAAVSPANARGLMQITPITVRQHAGRLNLDASDVDLKDPRVNLAFGQENLEMLRDSPVTQASLIKVMAAYNAGLTPVTKWNGQVNDQGDPLLYMESIPYWETRSYVAIVMRNYWMYERQAGDGSPSRQALAADHWPMFPGQSGGSSSGRVYLTAVAEN